MEYKAPLETHTGKIREVTLGTGVDAVKIGGQPAEAVGINVQDSNRMSFASQQGRQTGAYPTATHDDYFHNILFS